MLTGLCCLQDSGCVAVPQLPGALSAGPVQPGRVSWAVFCGAPAPRRASDRRFARAWPAPTATGTKGMWCTAARSSRPALPKPLPRDPGSVSQPWGDRRGLGVHVSRGLTASQPLGTWEPHGDSRVAQRLLQDGAARGRAQSSGCPLGCPVGKRGCPELQSPALLSAGIQRAPRTWELPRVARWSRASCRLGCSSPRRAVPAQGSVVRSQHSPWQLLTLLDAPERPPACPPLFAQLAQGWRHEKLSDCVC